QASPGALPDERSDAQASEVKRQRIPAGPGVLVDEQHRRPVKSGWIRPVGAFAACRKTQNRMAKPLEKGSRQIAAQAESLVEDKRLAGCLRRDFVVDGLEV